MKLYWRVKNERTQKWTWVAAESKRHPNGWVVRPYKSEVKDDAS